MTKKEACKILALPPGADKNEIKKRYRQLMQQVHPDVGEALREDYAYSVQEINLAYAVLTRQKASVEQRGNGRQGNNTATEKETGIWDAPVNENAYAEREILQFAEDCEGVALGEFCIARGKYLWTTEEDFPLFLRSIADCGRRLLDRVDEKRQGSSEPESRQRTLGELVYLLAQQFMNGSALVRELSGKETADGNGNPVFGFPAMVELPQKAALQEGEALYPAAVRQHRLYLKNRAGQELGYLSFPDDRLYYVIIPLFEQRRVQVRIRVAREREKEKRRRAGYRRLHLWIRLSSAGEAGMPESLNLRIRELLEAYGRT